MGWPSPADGSEAHCSEGPVWVLLRGRAPSPSWAVDPVAGPGGPSWKQGPYLQVEVS